MLNRYTKCCSNIFPLFTIFSSNLMSILFSRGKDLFEYRFLRWYTFQYSILYILIKEIGFLKAICTCLSIWWLKKDQLQICRCNYMITHCYFIMSNFIRRPNGEQKFLHIYKIFKHVFIYVCKQLIFASILSSKYTPIFRKSVSSAGKKKCNFRRSRSYVFKFVCRVSRGITRHCAKARRK